FTNDDDVRITIEILVRIVCALRPSEHDRPPMAMPGIDDPEHGGTRHEIRVHTEHSTGLTRQPSLEDIAIAERAIEDVDAESRALEIRAQIEQAERRIRLHDPLLLLVFPQ